MSNTIIPLFVGEFSMAREKWQRGQRVSDRGQTIPLDSKLSRTSSSMRPFIFYQGY